jgi:hypothetical protein
MAVVKELRSKWEVPVPVSVSNIVDFSEFTGTYTDRTPDPKTLPVPEHYCISTTSGTGTIIQ